LIVKSLHIYTFFLVRKKTPLKESNCIIQNVCKGEERLGAEENEEGGHMLSLSGSKVKQDVVESFA